MALEAIQSFASLVWHNGGVRHDDYTYTADKEKGRLLINGQTIEQATAPKVVVPTSDIQRQAQAVRERNAGQARDTDRRREQRIVQERQERRGRKL